MAIFLPSYKKSNSESLLCKSSLLYLKLMFRRMFKILGVGGRHAILGGEKTNPYPYTVNIHGEELLSWQYK